MFVLYSGNSGECKKSEEENNGNLICVFHSTNIIYTCISTWKIMQFYFMWQKQRNRNRFGKGHQMLFTFALQLQLFSFFLYYWRASFTKNTCESLNQSNKFVNKVFFERNMMYFHPSSILTVYLRSIIWFIFSYKFYFRLNMKIVSQMDTKPSLKRPIEFEK